MKNRLLASVAILALGTSGAVAADIGGYYADPTPSYSSGGGAAGVFGDVHLSATYFGGDVDDWSIDLGGVVVVPFGNGWNAALEGDASYLFDAEDWVAAVTGHAFYLTQGWAAGVFASINTEDMSSVGVEGAAFINNIDVVASAEYSFENPNFWTVAVGGNFYLNPNTAVSAGLSTSWADGADDFQTASLGVEHRFNSSPVSAFGNLGWTNAGSDDAFIGQLGARYVFGTAGSTLQDYNRANPF